MAQQGKNKSKPNQPPPDDDDDDGGDDGDGLSEGQQKQVLKLVNSALSGQLNRKLGPAVKAELAPVLEQLQKLAPAPKDDDQDDDDQDDEAPPAGKKGKGKPDPMVSKMSKQLDAMKRQLEDEKNLRTKEADARKASKIETTLAQLLTEMGVDKNRIRGALAIHKGAASYDEESDKVMFKVKRDGYDEDVEPVRT
jgi:hypothetical protein